MTSTSKNNRTGKFFFDWLFGIPDDLINTASSVVDDDVIQVGYDVSRNCSCGKYNLFKIKIIF